MTARPMRDAVREALFNHLEDLEGCRALDLFAGSGSLGLEAISRGAARVVFCEKAARCLSAIRKNTESLGIGEEAVLRRTDLARPLAPLGELGPFQLALMDPPFPLLRSAPAPGEPDIRSMLRELGSGAIMTPNARVAFETPSRSFRIEPELEEMGFELGLRREYGSTALWVLHRLVGAS